MPLITIARTSDLQPGQGKLFEVQGAKIALFAASGAYYAIDDTCTHSGCPLSQGTVQAESVTCPCHGSMFDLRTGQVLHPPAMTPVRVYRVVVAGQEIKVDLP